MEHRNTKLTAYTRLKMITDQQQGRNAQEIADSLGISRKTFYYWRSRYQREGSGGLINRPSGPRCSPRRSSAELEEKVLAYRKDHPEGPARIAIALGMPASTVYSILKRHGKNQLNPKQQREAPTRYEKDEPGKLVHIDVKELVALPGGAKEYHFSAVDDHTRTTYADIFSEQTTQVACQFLEATLASFPFTVKKVMTDNSFIFTMRHAFHNERQSRFEKLLEAKGIKLTVIRPYHPETNGKVERFHRTVEEEFYRRYHFEDASQRRQMLPDWLAYYNNSRPHLGIGGLSPAERLALFFNTPCHQVA